MAKVKGSNRRKPASRSRKSPAKGGGTTGAIRVRRNERAYRRADTPVAREVRSGIDDAVRRGEELRKEIEAKIKDRFENKRRW